MTRKAGGLEEADSGRADGEAGGGAEGEGIRRKSGRTGRRYCSRSRKRRAGGSSRPRKKIRWTRFTRRLKRNCAANTAWGTRRTRMPGRGITRSCWRRSRKNWWCRPGMGITRGSEAGRLAKGLRGGRCGAWVRWLCERSTVAVVEDEGQPERQTRLTPVVLF